MKNRLPLARKGIGFKLTTSTIFFSSIITLVITAFHLYARYTYDVNLIDLKFKQIQDIHLSSIISNLWLVDKNELQVHMKGLLKIQDIQYIEVYDNEKLWASAGKKHHNKIVTREYPLKYAYKDKIVDIGMLKVGASLHNVYQNIYQELWVTLATNGVKTFLVAFFMLFLFHKLVVRHLIKISNDLTLLRVKDNDRNIQLDRNRAQQETDEIDLLVNAFNELQKELRLSFLSIEEKVQQRTQELLQAREEAIAASSAKTEFLSRISHEFRTPLNAVLGFAQLLHTDDNLTETQKSNIDEILTAGGHLLELISEVLDLSRIESGTLALTLTAVRISDVIDESVSLVRPLAEKKNIALQWQGTKQQNLLVLGEKFRLKEVLINLLSNAIKYNVDNGTIIINTETSGSQLRIDVIDSGMGLTPEQQQVIFNPFDRAGQEITNIEGAGIGLTIAKRLIEMMQGEIGVESSLGKGSCFYLLVKLADE
ncbi:MAG: ATP-binding protein [Gammaproteobacteria bacterium]|nr:ATP-binding protein [Gammaproteobacteria bacterium]